MLVIKRFTFLLLSCMLLAVIPAGAAQADVLSDPPVDTHVVSNLLPDTGEVVDDLVPGIGGLIDGPNGLL